MIALTSLISRQLFLFLFAVTEKDLVNLHWTFNSIGSPRFWESLIGIDNHKGLFNKMPMMFHACVINNYFLCVINNFCHRSVGAHFNEENTKIRAAVTLRMQRRVYARFQKIIIFITDLLAHV